MPAIPRGVTGARDALRSVGLNRRGLACRMTSQGPGLDELVAATPASRDRYVDFLRAASIGVVMLGHWTMAVVEYRDGSWSIGNVLSTFRPGWILTWFFQVMPVFFMVGGFSNLVTLDALERDRAGYAAYARSRTWRLVKPVLVLLAIWLPLALAAEAWAPGERGVLRQATQVVTQPLWFVGIYLIVTALAPSMRALHRRHGALVVVALALAAALVDVVRFTLAAPGIGVLNFALVWLQAQQLGFLYADGVAVRMPRRGLWATLALAIGALALLTTVGPYPRSMVGLPGEAMSNMNPPTFCLVAVTWAQAAVLLLIREPVRRWLDRPRAWRAVIAANGSIMTLFLWHLTALMLVAVIALPAGFPQPRPGSAAWWLLRPFWILLLSAGTVPAVFLLARFERTRSRPHPARPRGALYASIGVALAAVAILGFAVTGLVDFVYPGDRRLVFLPVSPLINLVALAAAGLAFAAGADASPA